MPALQEGPRCAPPSCSRDAACTRPERARCARAGTTSHLRGPGWRVQIPRPVLGYRGGESGDERAGTGGRQDRGHAECGWCRCVVLEGACAWSEGGAAEAEQQNSSTAETTFDSQSQTAHTQSRNTVQEQQRPAETLHEGRQPPAPIGLSGRTDPFFVYVVVVLHARHLKLHAQSFFPGAVSVPVSLSPDPVLLLRFFLYFFFFLALVPFLTQESSA